MDASVEIRSSAAFSPVTVKAVGAAAVKSVGSATVESTAEGQKVLRRTSVELLDCLQAVDPQRRYATPPRRILTADTRSTSHGGWDNALKHAIVAVGDVVRTGPGDDACVYQVTDALGAG